MQTFKEYLAEASVQNRGICQVCGREQAVQSNGRIAHHGYQVVHGYFVGTCPGGRHQPMQVSKDESERQITMIKAEIPKLKKQLADLKAGRIVPEEVPADSLKKNSPMIPFKDAPPRRQYEEVQRAIIKTENRIKSGEFTVKMLKELISKYFGGDLRQVARVPASAKPKIVVGSKVRVLGKEVTVEKIEFAIAKGVGPKLNGSRVEHVFWTEDGRERKYPLRNARLVS